MFAANDDVLLRRERPRPGLPTIDRRLADLAALIEQAAAKLCVLAGHTAAQSLGSDLGAVVTYDQRVAQAVGRMGMTVESPT